MLWCPGIPGAGKTFLASIVVDHLRKRDKKTNTILLVLYCGYNEAKSQSIDNLVAALIKQILQNRPVIGKELKEMYKTSTRTDVFPSLQELTKILLIELAHFDSCYIIVDALDEIFDEASRLSLLETLVQCKANILVTSRPLNSIRELFVQYDSVSCDRCEESNPTAFFRCKQCSMDGFSLCDACHSGASACGIEGHYSTKSFATYEVEIEATEDDVRNYVQWRIDQEPKLLESVTRKRVLREEIAGTIVQQANGMYVSLEFGTHMH